MSTTAIKNIALQAQSKQIEPRYKKKSKQKTTSEIAVFITSTLAVITIVDELICAILSNWVIAFPRDIIQSC